MMARLRSILMQEGEQYADIASPQRKLDLTQQF